MTIFSYSFCMAMLHSLWQSGVLLLFFIAGEKLFIHKHSPLAKRNLLFILIATQLALFVGTFLNYFLESNGGTGIGLAIEPSEILYRLTPWLFMAYTGVIIFKVLAHIYNWYRFKTQYRIGLQKPNIDLKLFTMEKAFRFGIKRKVSLWLSNTINTPLTFGSLKPVILLPVALVNNISTQQAEALIIHELVHIRMNDYLLNWFLVAIETIFFFNPFVRIISKKIRLEREQNCDLNVIAFEYKPALYAEALLKAEKIKRMIPGLQLAAVSKKKQLLHRIHFFSGQQSFKRRPGLALAVPLFAMATMLAIFGITPGAKDKAAEPSFISAIQTGFQENYNAEYTPPFAVSYPEINEEAVNKTAAEIEKRKPVLEKHLRHLARAIDKSTGEVANNFTEEDKNNLAIPAATWENDATQEIVINEEASGTQEASVKIYNLRFVNNQWVLEPKIMVVKIPKIDSVIHVNVDTQLKRLLPAQ